jgi:hypothetical protein
VIAIALLALLGPARPLDPALAELARERREAAADRRHAPWGDPGAPRLGTRARVGREGATVAVARGQLTMAVRRWARGSTWGDLGAEAAPVIAGPEVRLARGAGIVEWWRSLASGLEHGVTLRARPPGTGLLALEIACEGASPIATSVDEISLRDAAGREIARYGHLHVIDAEGRRAPAELAVRDGAVRIEIDDAHARYPLVVDPLLYGIEEATLLAPDGAANDLLGQALAVTGDGSRAVAGVIADDVGTRTNAGSARVFVRAGTTWTAEATLAASDAAVGDQLGTSVAIAADGSRVLAGAPYDDVTATDQGSARVFVRTGSTWAEEATLVAAGAAAIDGLGSSVALDASATRAAVGASLDFTPGGIGAGSVRVFVRAGTTWTEEAALLAPDGASDDHFGAAVAITGDGTRVIVGAPDDDTVLGADSGTVRVFVRGGTTWAQEASLPVAGISAGERFGSAVAISADGSRAIVGIERDGGFAGSVRIFVRSGATWAEEASIAGSGRLGSAVSISDDGARALVGARTDPAAAVQAGSASVLARTGTVWTRDATLLASDAALNDQLGHSVAISGDATRAFAGAIHDDTPLGGADAGSVRVFSLVPSGPDGAACTRDDRCVSGFCVEGVCCDTACGGDVATDCQECGSGTCSVRAAGVGCGAPSAGACDPADACDGASPLCLDVRLVAGTPCRMAGGACDRTEVCDGTSAACPGDVREPAGVVCRSARDLCDVDERCDGAGTTCPPDAVAPLGVVCRSAIGACDAEDRCDGATATCTNTFQPASVVCDPVATDVCDAPDTCTGTSAECPERYLAGVECRAARGACDRADVCSGTSPTCPPDVVLSAGVECRGSIDAACDPAEACDGIAATCPADVRTCDAEILGEDGGPVRDAGGGDDAASTDAGHPTPIAGCACRAARRGATPAPAIAIAIVLVLAGALGRRRG